MVKSQLEILAQAQSYLINVTESDYTKILAPNFISSAGAHIRHIIDHYLAVITGFDKKLIDYDVRTRGGNIEYFPHLTLLIPLLSWTGRVKEIYLSNSLSLNSPTS